MISIDTVRYNTFHKLNSSSLQNETEKYNDNELSILTTKERIVAPIRNSIIILVCLSTIILVLYLASFGNFVDRLRRFIMWVELKQGKGCWQKRVLWYLKPMQLYTITNINRYEIKFKNIVWNIFKDMDCLILKIIQLFSIWCIIHIFI